MRKILFILICLLILSSCTERVDTISNYPNGIIVGKPIYRNSTSTRLQIKYYNRIGGKYTVKTIRVSKFEYDLVQLVDTIKR